VFYWAYNITNLESKTGTVSGYVQSLFSYVLNTKVYSETTKIKLKVDQHKPPIKMGLILGAPEGKAVPVTLFANQFGK
jgi:hypothetical protein